MTSKENIQVKVLNHLIFPYPVNHQVKPSLVKVGKYYKWVNGIFYRDWHYKERGRPEPLYLFPLRVIKRAIETNRIVKKNDVYYKVEVKFTSIPRNSLWKYHTKNRRYPITLTKYRKRLEKAELFKKLRERWNKPPSIFEDVSTNVFGHPNLKAEKTYFKAYNRSKEKREIQDLLE